MAKSKQTADHLRNSKFSFQISLLCEVLVLEDSKCLFVKSKQSAESKQTADHLKNSEFPFQTSLLWEVLVLEASKWLFCEK